MIPQTRRAFTLIELLVVILFIAVMASVIVPAYANFKRSTEFKKQLRDIQDIFAYAREQAVSRDTTATVTFDQQTGTFVANVTAPPPITDQPAQFATNSNPDATLTSSDIAPQKTQIDQRYQVAPIADPNGSSNGGTSQAVFHFRNDGTVEGGSVLLEDREMHYTAQLQLWPATGRMTLEEEPKPQ